MAEKHAMWVHSWPVTGVQPTVMSPGDAAQSCRSQHCAHVPPSTHCGADGAEALQATPLLGGWQVQPVLDALQRTAGVCAQ